MKKATRYAGSAGSSAKTAVVLMAIAMLLALMVMMSNDQRWEEAYTEQYNENYECQAALNETLADLNASEAARAYIIGEYIIGAEVPT